MERSPLLQRLTKNMNNLHELGRQRAFELGNPFYAKFSEDGAYYRKELPTGEKFLVTVKVILDENDFPVRIEDTIIKQLV
jgi:ssDNA-specific exonuclease RecJ